MLKKLKRMAGSFKSRSAKKADKRKPPSRKIHFEALESRLLLSADISLSPDTIQQQDLLANPVPPITENFLIGTSDADNLLSGPGNDNLSGLEGDDTYIFQSDWGNDTVTENAGEGNDTLDFSALDAPLTFTFHADGSVTITDGANTVDASNIESLIGGGNYDTYIFEDGSVFNGNIYGGAGTDTIIASNSANTWNITGANSGTLNDSQQFGDIENLTGGIGNEDTFIFTASACLSGLIEGGAGGFDTLVLEGGSYNTMVFTPTGPDSGTVALDGNVIGYSGLEPIISPVPTDNIIFNLTIFGDEAIIEAASGSDMQIRSTNSTFETTTFSIPTSSLTINGGDGDDSVTIVSSLIMPGADLTINAETITVNSGVTIDTGAGNIALTASDSSNGGILGTDILANSSATINISGATIIGNDISITATSTVNVDSESTDLFGGAVKLGVITSDSSAAVTADNTTITSAGTLVISSTSNVTTTVTTAPDSSSNDTSSDAAVAISIVGSAASVNISGGANLTTNGTANISSNNTVNITTTADGTAGGSAGSAKGGTLGVSVLYGNTEVTLSGSTLAAADVALSATSSRTVTTSAKAAQGGASSGGGSNESEQRLQDPDDDVSTSDQASTSDGGVNFAAAVAVTIATGDTSARISGGTVTSSTDIDITASATHALSTIADGSPTSGSSGTGVGVGVGFSFADVASIASIGGPTSLSANAINMQALMPSSTFSVEAKSGAKGDSADVGVAGSLAINITIADANALIESGANLNINGANLTITAQSTTESTAKALPKENTSGESVGVGASVALNIGTINTSSKIEDTAILTGSNDINLSATGSYKMTTEAKGGAEGGTAVTPVVGISIANNSTSAVIGTGSPLALTGNLNAGATHTSSTITNAEGDAEGSDAAVGASLALTFANNMVSAITERSITSSGAVSFTANSSASSRANAKASAKGAEGDSSGSPNVNSQASSQRSLGDNRATNSGATNSGSTSTPSAESSDGAVSVAAAIGVNIALSETTTSIADGTTISAGGLLTLSSTNNTDGAAKADGSAVDGSIATGIGAAVAVNYADVVNEAYIGNAAVTSSGVNMSAIMKAREWQFDPSTAVDDSSSNETIDLGAPHWFNTGDVIVYSSSGGNSIGGLTDGDTYYVIADDQAPNKIKLASSLDNARKGEAIDLNKSSATGTGHTLTENTNSFSALARAGAAGTDVGVAGALAINIMNNHTEAIIKSGGTINAGSGDVSLTAENTSSNAAKATSKVQGSADTGVGASVALNIAATNITRAEIEDTAILTGGNNVNLSATSVHTMGTIAEAGSAGDVAVSPAVAISITDNDTTSRIGTGATALNITGALNITATHTNLVMTGGNAEAAGGDVGVGAIVGITIASDDVIAAVARNVVASGNVAIAANSRVVSRTETKASIKGNSDSGQNSDSETNHQVNDNTHTRGSSGRTMPTAESNTNQANSSATSESSTGSSSVGVAAAVSVNWVTANNTASIANGVVITSGGAVSVSAASEIDATAKAVGAAVTLSESDNIGAAVGLNVATVTNKAFIDGGATVDSSGITIEAVTTNDEKNEFIAWGAAAGGGSSDVGVAGSVGINVVNFTTEASARSGSNLISTDALTITAENDMGIQTLAAGGGFSTGTAAGAAVSVGIITSSTKAFIAGNADAAGALSVTAETDISPIRADVPLLGDSDDPTITSLAVAGGASSGDVGMAGAVAFNKFNLTTYAYIDDSSQINQDPAIIPSGQSVTVHAIDNTRLTNIAGSLGLTTGSAGVGAGLDLGIITKDTRAYIGSGALVDAAGAVLIDADSSEDILSIVGNAGAGDSAGVAGSASVQIINTGTRAYIEGTPIGVAAYVNAGGDVTLSSNGTFTAKMIAGSVGAGSSAGVGASNTTLVHNDTVEAYVGERATVTSAGTTGLSVTAISSENLITIAAAGSGAGSAAVAGSAVVNVLNENTWAYISRGATITASNGAIAGTPGISVSADEDTAIISIAGSLAGAGTAAVGVGADVGVITKNTKAFIDSNVTANAEGDISLIADSSEDITSVAAGLAGAGSVSVALDASVHVLNIKTRAFIGDDPTDVIASAGAGNVHASGNVLISADEHTEIDKVVGVLAVATYAGIGAAGGVTVIDKTTEAFIGAGAHVSGDGNTTGITVNTGGFNLGVTASPTFDPNDASGEGIEATDSSTLSSSSTDLSTSGEVNVPNLAVMDADQQSGDDLTDSSFSGQRTAAIGTQSGFRGVAVTSTNRDDIESFTLSLAGGIAGVAVSAGINVVDADTRAYVGQNALVNADTSGANALQSVHIAAGSDFYQLAVAGTLAGGVVGVSPAADVTVLGNTTEAYIGSGATVNAKNDITVEAHASEDMLLIGFGMAGGVVGVGGAVSVLSIDNTTSAYIGANAAVYAGGDVLVYATDNTDVDMISGALAGGFVGVGGSVGVLSITKNTQAFIGSNAHVDALGAGAGISGVLNGDMVGGGDSFGTVTGHGVIVQAQSSEDVFHLAVTGSGGFVGVAGGVAVTLIDSDTTSYIGNNVQVNRADIDSDGIVNEGANSNQSVFVNASNEVRVISFAGAVSGGFVGVAGAVDVGSIKNDTSAQIRSGAQVSAANDVEVNALGIKELDGFTFSGAGGFVGLSAAVSVWSIGDSIEKNYSDNDGNTQNSVLGDARDDTDDDGDIDDDDSAVDRDGDGDIDDDDRAADVVAAKQAQESRGYVSSQLDAFPDGNTADSNDSNTERLGAATGTASSRLSSDAPSQTDITSDINSASTASGTTALIASGVIIDAGDDIQVTANEDVEVDIIVGGFAGGFVGIGGSVSVTNIAANATASAGGILSAGGDITVKALLDENVNITSLAGGVGFVGLGAAVVVLNDTSTISASIAGGAQILEASSVTVLANSDPDFSVVTGQATIGVGAVGASFTRLSVGNPSAVDVSAYIGDNAQIGQGAGNIGSLAVTADSTILAHSQTYAIAAGAVAVSANFAFVDVTPDIRAYIGAGADIDVTGNAEIKSIAELDADAYVFTATGGLGASGASIANANLSPDIETYIGAFATLDAGGAITLESHHNHNGIAPISGRGAHASADSPSITLAGSGTGTLPTATSSADVKTYAASGAQLSAGSNINVKSFSSNNASATGRGLSIGLGASFGVTKATATADGMTKAYINGSIGDPTQYGALNLAVTAIDDSRATADAEAPSASLLASGNAAIATSTVSPTVEAYLGGSQTVRVSGGVVIGATSITDSNATAQGISGSLGIKIGGSVAIALLTPHVYANIGSATVAAGSGSISVTASHNQGTTNGATANATASGGAAISGSGAFAIAKMSRDTDDPDSNDDYFLAVDAHVASGATLSAGQDVILQSISHNETYANSGGLDINGLGLGISQATAIINGTQTAYMSGASIVSRDVKVLLTSDNDADAIVKSLNGSFIGGVANNNAVATVNPTQTTYIGGQVIAGNDVEVKGDVQADAFADSQGVSVTGVFDIRNSNATATMQPLVDTYISAVNVTADRNITVKSQFNRTDAGFVSKGAEANASSSGGSLGVSGGGATATATSQATVKAHAGGPDSTITATNGTVTIKALSYNDTHAIADGLAIGGLAGIGIVNATATGSGTTEAFVADSTLVNRSELFGGGLEVNATAGDRALSDATAAAGGFVGSGSSVTANANVNPTVRAEIGAAALVDVSGGVEVNADSATEADANSNGIALAGIFAGGGSTANVTVVPTVSALADNSASINANGSITIRAKHNDPATISDGTFNAAMAVDITNDRINIPGHGLSTGDRITYTDRGYTTIGGLTSPDATATQPEGTSYSAIVVNSNLVRLGAVFNPGDTTTPPVNIDNDTIQFRAAHGFQNGQRVFYDPLENTPVGGLAAGAYYVRVLDDFTIKLYNTQAEALSAPKTFGASGVDNAADKITFASNHGFVQNQAVSYFAPSSKQFGAEAVETSGINDNIISILNHGFSDGAHVTYRVEPGGAPITSLSSGADYYIERVDDNQIKLFTWGTDSDGNPIRVYQNIAVPSASGALDDIHFLSAFQQIPLNGLTDGKTYYVDVVDGNKIHLLNAPDGTVVNISNTGVSGTHNILPAGKLLDTGGSGTQAFYIDLTATGSGTQKLIGAGGVSGAGRIPDGDGLSKANATGLAGALFAGLGNVDSFTTVNPTVSAAAGNNTILDAAGNIFILSDSSANGGGKGSAIGAGFVGVGFGDAVFNSTHTVSSTVGSNASILAEGNITIDADSSYTANARHEAVGGGVVSGADADAFANINHYTHATVESGATVAAGGNLAVEATGTFGGTLRANADSGGFATNPESDAKYTVNATGSGRGTHVHIGSNANVSAEGQANLISLVRSTYIGTHAIANAYGVLADTDAESYITIYSDAKVLVDGGATVTGVNNLSVKAEHQALNTYTEAVADGKALSDSDADVKFRPYTYSVVDGEDNATFESRDLQVKANVFENNWGYSWYYFGAWPVSGGSADVNVTGDPIAWTAGRTIQWDSDVVLLPGPNPELVINASGQVITAIDVTVDGGNGVGYVIPDGDVSVDSIYNDEPGHALFETNDLGLFARMGGGMFPTLETFKRSGNISGTNGVFFAQHTFDNVTITNQSTKDLIINGIYPIDRDGDPDGQVNINADDVTMQFDIKNSFEPTLIEILSTNTSSTTDIILAGAIDNPIGTTRIDNRGGDILSSGSAQPIRSNIVELNAAGSIGSVPAVSGGVKIDLVESAGRPETLNATANGDAVLDIRGVLRDPAISNFTVNIGTLDAGNNIDLYLREAIKETTISGVGSYALMVDLNNYYDLNDDPVNPASAPYARHFRPDTPGDLVYTGPLEGVFGSGAVAIESIYDFVLMQAGGDIDVNANLSGQKINITGFTNITGLGNIDVRTNGYITLEETVGDMRVGDITSTEDDVTLTSPADIVDALNDVEADVTCINITLTAASGAIGSSSNYLDINSANPGYGVLNATAMNDIFIIETSGNLNVDCVMSTTSDVTLITIAGSILDGGGCSPANIEANDIDLIAVGGGIGSASGDLFVDSSNPGTGRLWAEADDSIYITETDGSLNVALAESYNGNVQLTVPDTTDTDEHLNVLANGARLDGSRAISRGRIAADVDGSGSVTLLIGDDVTTTDTSDILASAMITIRGDHGDADPAGTTMNLRGVITPGAGSTHRTDIFGNADDDAFIFNQTYLGGQTNVYGSDSTTIPGPLSNDGFDSFIINELQTMNTSRIASVSGEMRRDTLNLDGQADTDFYSIQTGGSMGGAVNGALRDYVISVLDSGAKDDGVDTLEINGTSDADIFLLRQANAIKDGQPAPISDNSPAFVALLHGNISEVLDNAPSRPTQIERINYNEDINARLIVRGGEGDDYFASDDSSAITTLDGGAGSDTFQIGQIFGTRRVAPDVPKPEDAFDTIRTTRGDLSKGVTFPMTVYGGTGNDKFTVYSNQAQLRLEGNDGNDEFIIRAFVLANEDYSPKTTGLSTDNTTLVLPGDGDDLVQYNINAPVDVDGGAGFDKLVVLGTEFADNFAITKEAIYGAGLKVTYTNIEAVEVDGLEGNDHFFVLSTKSGVVTTVIGGLGSDVITVAGDVTGTIVSRELEGRSAMINHTVIADTNTDADYDGLLAPGLDLNVATPDIGQVIIEETGGSTIVAESGSTTDTYTVRLATAPEAGKKVYVTVSGARTTSEEESLAGDSMDVSSDGVTFDKYVVLVFDDTNWNTAQTVTVRAVNDGLPEAERVYAVSHSTLSADTRFNHVAVTNVKVTVLDNDKPGVTIKQTSGSTLVLEGAPPQGINDNYTVELAKAPAAGDTVTVTLGFDTAQLSVASSDTRYDSATNSITFTSANWNLPVMLNLSAVDDAIAENRGESTITHTVTSTDTTYIVSTPATLEVDLLDNDSAGVLVQETNGATLVVVDNPATLADESVSDTYLIRLTKAPVGDVTVQLVSDGQTILTSADTRFATVDGKPAIVFNATNWYMPAVINVAADPTYVPVPGAEFIKPFPKSEHLLNDIRGPLFVEGGITASDRSITKALVLPGEATPPLPLIGPFPPELTRVDVLRIYNDASVSDDTGTMGDAIGPFPYNVLSPQATRLSGLGMGGDLTVNQGSEFAPVLVTYNGGITYNAVEIFELLLGQGDDTLTINNTLHTGADHGGLSLIHGGGNTFGSDIRGADTFIVTGNSGGSDSPLVVYGDTSADGYRYSGESGVISENAIAYDNWGNDIVDASASTDSVVVYGGRGDDLIIGSQAGDTLSGGSGNDRIFGQGGNDHIFGDSGINVEPVSRSLYSSMAGTPAGAMLDDITATTVDSGRQPYADTLDGGSDLIFGETGNDIVFGDHGIITQSALTVLGTIDELGIGRERIVESRSNTNGNDDTIFGNEGEDVLIGGAAGDSVDGGAQKDIIFGDNVHLDRTGSIGDQTNPRFRALSGTEIYGRGINVNSFASGQVLVNGVWQRDPAGTPVWNDFRISLLDHSMADEAAGQNNFGNDYIAGGADDDMIFGQLGDDTIQGDGSIGTFAGDSYNRAVTPNAVNAQRLSNGLLAVSPSVENVSDGDDYIEGNGGNDVIFGNLGQDDIIGGSSSLFNLVDRTQRPDSSDLIFGGAGTDISRNNLGDETVNGHAEDSDMILGDNGNIYRLVGTNGIDTGAYLSFNYDNYGSVKIIPRAAELLDYTLGGMDYNPAAAALDIGADDELHGESGDDFMYGTRGNDILFGEGQDDDLIAGYGNDWASGGAGQDGIIGDDGRIFTSRNSSAYGEPLYGINAIPATELNRFITTPGDVQQAYINIPDELKKTVDITPFSQEPGWMATDDEFGGTSTHCSDDIVYGGLGNDWLHGGSGEDAISGAEALPRAAALHPSAGVVISGYDTPVNLGNMLAFNPVDLDGQHQNRTRAGEFALYDEYNPLQKITLSLGGETLEFLLNFDKEEGPETTSATWGIRHTDGNDRIFGDLGNDWIVGGTGRDNLYGGWGNDLLQADDALDTNNGANTAPDTHPSYEDRAYGGAGRDVLIANTGGDRLIDWVGEFNSYIVPFAPFGIATVSRTVQPQLSEFLYALSASDGIDMTRAADEGSDQLRNGEPFGELGLVRQHDFAWHDQTGGPSDPQAGNLPGGRRDVLRSASFNDGTMDGFFVDSGKWSVANSALQVSADSQGGDAVAVYHIGDALPVYFEVQASINVLKPNSGWKANSYLIFDYNSMTDFKFTGIDISINKLVMGHRDASGWHVDKQTSFQAKPGTYYNMTLAINGLAASIIVNNKTLFTHTYAPRVIDGYSYGLNWGLVGMGSDNSRGTFDNIRVQILPPQITFKATDEFTTGSIGLFTGKHTGTWSVLNERYIGTPLNGQSTAMNLIDLGVSGLQVSSVLELSSKVNTQGRAGFIFDCYSDNDFKFAAIDASAEKVIIGHYTAKGGWLVDAAVSKNISAGTDYTLGISLKGSTVSVTLNGQAVIGHAFNAVVVDGDFGLFSSDGSSSFDTVTVKTNDPAFNADNSGSNLTAVTAPFNWTGEEGVLKSGDDLSIIVEEAKHRLFTAFNDEVVKAQLDNVTFQIADLPGLILGKAIGNTVLIDTDAAGHGWFIDKTASDDSEFINDTSGLVAMESNLAFGAMDLLTVVTHELGHVLGLEHTDNQERSFEMMDAMLASGIRIVPVYDNTTDGQSSNFVGAEIDNSLVKIDSLLINFEADRFIEKESRGNREGVLFGDLSRHQPHSFNISSVNKPYYGQSFTDKDNFSYADNLFDKSDIPNKHFKTFRAHTPYNHPLKQSGNSKGLLNDVIISHADIEITKSDIINNDSSLEPESAMKTNGGEMSNSMSAAVFGLAGWHMVSSNSSATKKSLDRKAFARLEYEGKNRRFRRWQNGKFTDIKKIA